MTIRNNGPSNATGVVVTDPLPPQVTFGTATTSKGTTTFTNGSLKATIGNLAVGEVVTITVSTTIKPGTTGTILNVATVKGNQTETNLANNQDDEPTPVNSLVDLAIDKSDDIDPVTAGGVLTYTLVVSNNGPSVATGVVAADTLPTNIKLLTVATTKGTYTISGRNVAIAMGNLAVGEQQRVTIRVLVDKSFVGTLLNRSKVDGNEIETTYDNNRDDEPTRVEPLPSSIGGFVYADADNDGVFDATEKPIAGVLITLTGTDDLGAVTFTAKTDAKGAYLFTNLRPGKYSIKEGTVLGKFLDGKDTVGSPTLGTTLSNDLFSNITLPPTPRPATTTSANGRTFQTSRRAILIRRSTSGGSSGG